MATKVIAPKLGMSTEPLTIVEWKAREGGRIEKGSVVLVVETEASGLLHLLVKEGKEMPIGSTTGLSAETKEEPAVLQKEVPKGIATAADTNGYAPDAGSAVKLVKKLVT